MSVYLMIRGSRECLGIMCLEEFRDEDGGEFAGMK